MSHDRLTLAVIIGSTREGRFGPVPAGWFVEQARDHGDFDVELIDLAEANLPAVMTNAASPEADALGEKLAAADAFAVVTPEYNHSYPASLKNAIDYYHAEWNAKPVGLISYGGSAGGQRAVEHLRPVFCELHAMTVRDSLAFVNFWEAFDEDGRPVDSNGADAAAKALLDQLEWWGRSLREARDKRPYKA